MNKIDRSSAGLDVRWKTGLKCIKHWQMMSPMLQEQNAIDLFKPSNVMTGLVLITVVVFSLLWFSQSSEVMLQTEVDSTTTTIVTVQKDQGSF